MSEQAEQISGEPGSSGAEPVVSTSSHTNAPDAPSESVKASELAPAKAESPSLVPGQGADGAVPHASVPKVEIPKPTSSRVPAKVMIMSADDHRWDGEDTHPRIDSELGQGMFGKRRLSALAAVVALAAIAGAIGGAMATAGFQHVADNAAAPPAGNPILEASMARMDTDIQALKAGMDHASKVGMSQFNKTSERLDKVEKAQAEPAAKLAKLSEAVDKLRTAPAPVAAAAPAPAKEAIKEATGSITPPAAPPKPEVARLPTLEGWLLRDVANGGAVIEGRQGIFEVYAGDPVPGLGRVDAIRRQDGRWVVVTSRGLIVAR